MAELREYNRVARGAALLHQLTSPRTMRALIAVVLLFLTCYLVLAREDIPDVVSLSLATVLGSFFEVPKTSDETTGQKVVVKPSE